MRLTAGVDGSAGPSLLVLPLLLVVGVEVVDISTIQSTSLVFRTDDNIDNDDM